jgi:translocation and assembly module TamB
LRFDINSYGARTNPNVQGQIRIVNANFATGTVPIGLQNGNGVLTLTKDRLDITQFTGTVGGGTLKASGGVVYRPSLQFDLAMAGQGIRVLLPQGIRAGLGTTLALTGTPQQALLRGNVRINHLSFTPDFDLMNVAGSLGGSATPPPAQGFTQNLQLDIGVQSTSGLNLVSRTLSFDGAANLRVRGTAAEPVILGRININGGDLIFNGNRYLLNGGTVDFINPSQTQPVVDVSVATTIQQYNIQMRFWGPADHLHTTYASDPALPPADIINLLFTGKTAEAKEAQANEPSPPGNIAAMNMVASQVSSQVTSRLEKVAGISQLSVDPVLGGTAGQNPGARITIQQRVTSKIFVTFSTDVTSTQRQVIKLEYQASPRTSYTADRDENGGFGFDVRKHKTW